MLLWRYIKKQMAELNGILLMNKPEGFTSHDVVAKLRGMLKTRKIGHGGTLDPMATGVLPVFIGGATRAADFAAAQEKEYIAGFNLGFCTDTQDTTGKILEKSDKKIGSAEIYMAVKAIKGKQKQIPPMYSAVKIGGQKLYDLARKGKEIERPERDIFIAKSELISFDDQMQCGQIGLAVSKGTYVRTIIHDLGEKLGTYAAMNSLVRTRSGAYKLSECVDFETVQKVANEGEVQSLLHATDSLFLDYPAVSLTEEGAERATRGAVIFQRHTEKGFDEIEGQLYRVYDKQGFKMLGQIKALDKGGFALFVYKNFR